MEIPFKEYDQIFMFVVDAKPLDIVDGRLIIRIKNGVAILSQVVDNKKKLVHLTSK